MTISIMAKEAREAPQIIALQLRQNQQLCAKLGEQIRQHQPKFVYMIGRGSSDHAGVFAKYLIEVELGLPVTASAPSVSSVFGKTLALESALVIVISQSGRSPDILRQAEQAKNQGALCVALVNDESSPLTQLVDVVVPLKAGPEKAVAATKSYLATLSAILQFVAYWKDDQVILNALPGLPSAMEHVVNSAEQLNAEFIQQLTHCVVLGRGFGYAIGREIALKLKEVCSLHAEAFSSAEFLHGPVTLVARGLAIVDISLRDETRDVHNQQINEVDRRGAKLCHLVYEGELLHPRFEAILVLQRFYLDIEHIAQTLGMDPDSPAGLLKVTQTV
ncbi:glucosamine-6-phosphate deaminase NagB-II [Aliiglaciecola sp. M165]|uniref:glucosamine-6-phosphate deaminase NagB-II n=1 Tax=Aliiglaciecola sp. M165 TaxID=2593649 RepID=UPI00117F0822|nr:SIS domain-containing protein [Aliiglaciecola sp. M165]TRY29832.1 SIS domain-containing protein [Aliiglaciecola sp. M165]